MTKMGKFCLDIFVVLLTSISCPAYSDSPALPWPYTIPVGDLLFVMLTGHCEKHTEVHGGLTKQESQALREQIEASIKEEGNISKNKSMHDPCADLNALNNVHQSGRNPGLWEIRINTFKWEPKVSLKNKSGELYPESGLYPGNGSIVPIWSVNWYADSVRLSKDGRYLIRFGPWAMDYDNLAVAFYDKGALLHAYAIKDLVREPEKLPHSLSHLVWAHEIQFDKDENILHVATFGNEIYEFDATTGLLEKSSYNALPVFTVDAVTQSGERYRLSDFQSIRGSNLSINKAGLGESRRQFVFGQVAIEDEGASNEQKIGIPFSSIEQIDRAYKSDQDLVTWTVSLRTGDKIDMQVTVPYGPQPVFTGIQPGGETLYLELDDINKIVFRQQTAVY